MFSKKNTMAIFVMVTLMLISGILLVFNYVLMYKEYYSCPIPYHYIWEKLQIEIFWRGTWTGNKYGAPYEVVIRIPKTVHNKLTDFKPDRFIIWTDGREINVPVAEMKRFEGKNCVTFTYKWINWDLAKSDRVNYKLVMAGSTIKYEAKISSRVKNKIYLKNKLFLLFQQ